MPDSSDEVQLLKIFLQQSLGQQINFAYLLGSFGTERFNEKSDIDLAVFWNIVPDFSKIMEIKADWERKFGREVDLVSLNSADIIFSMQVLETGRLLTCGDPGRLLEWKVKQLAMYPDFKFSRKIIEKNILNRKRYV